MFICKSVHCSNKTSLKSVHIMLSRIMQKNKKSETSMATKSQLEYQAVLAQEVKRYGDMFEAMKHLMELKEGLTEEQQRLVCISYKEMIRSKRVAWRTIECQLDFELQNTKRSKRTLKLIREYRSKIQDEYLAFCSEMEYLLEKYLLPSTKDGKSLVLYNRLKADNYRYMAEISDLDDFTMYLVLGKRAYEKAMRIAESALDVRHPYRLGVVLNFSVFYSDVYNSPLSAHNLVKSVAMELYDLDKPVCDESLAILKLLNKNYDISYLEYLCGYASTGKEEKAPKK